MGLILRCGESLWPIRKLLVGSALLLPLFAMSSVEAQIRTIKSTIDCKNCRIELRKVLDLDPAEINTEPYVTAIDNTGTLFYYDGKEQAVKVFDSNGSLKSRFGRAGSGPGEMRSVRNLLLDSSGNLHLIDVELGRRSVFTKNGKLVSDHNIPPVLGGPGRPALLQPNGGLVVNALFTDRDAAGYSLLVTDHTGRRLKMLEESAMMATERWRGQRLLANARAGGFWVAKLYESEFLHYSHDLVNDIVVRRDASWFPALDPQRQPSTGVFDRRPDVMIASMWEDVDGLLWVVYLVPDPQWKPGPSPETVRRTRSPMSPLETRPRYKTRVEVLDTERSLVLAASEFNSIIGQSYSSGHVIDWKEDPATGEWRVSVSRLEIIKPNGRR